MNNFYEIDEIGKMELLSNLYCYSSSNEFKVEEHSITIGINSTDENEAKNLHAYIHMVLSQISNFDILAKERLKELYNSTERELEEIKVNHLDFYINKNFDLFYNLPEGSPVEYLSIKFSKNGVIVDSGGGNY